MMNTWHEITWQENTWNENTWYKNKLKALPQDWRWNGRLGRVIRWFRRSIREYPDRLANSPSKSLWWPKRPGKRFNIQLQVVIISSPNSLKEFETPTAYLRGLSLIKFPETRFGVYSSTLFWVYLFQFGPQFGDSEDAEDVESIAIFVSIDDRPHKRSVVDARYLKIQNLSWEVNLDFTTSIS